MTFAETVSLDGSLLFFFILLAIVVLVVAPSLVVLGCVMAFRAGRGSSRAALVWFVDDVVAGAVTVVYTVATDAVLIAVAAWAAVLAFQGLLFHLGRRASAS